MRKLNVITATLLLSIGTSCVSAAALSGLTHRRNPALATHFAEVVRPLNNKIARQHPAVKNFKSVSGVQRPAPSFTPQVFQWPSVSVVNKDTLTAVLELIAKGFKKPAALILANKTTPGGGVEVGATAQEEIMYRKTTADESTKEAKKRGHYPLGQFSAIYSPTVYEHNHVDEMHSFAFISMAGYRATAGTVDEADMPKDPKEFIEGMKEKIRVILSTAIVNGHTSIVLGALGCGAFAKDANNNVIPEIPLTIAATFAQVLNEIYRNGVSYLHHFQNVVFAIKEDTPNLIPIFERALGITAGDSGVVSPDMTAQRGAAPAKSGGDDIRTALSAALTQHLGAVPNLMTNAVGFFYNGATGQTTGETSAFIERMIPPKNPEGSWSMYITWDDGKERMEYFVLVPAKQFSDEGNAWLSAHAAHLESVEDANRGSKGAAPARALPTPSYNPAPAQPAGYGLAPQNAAPAAAHTAPVLDPKTLKETVKAALALTTDKSVVFSNDRYTPTVLGTAVSWTGDSDPWAAAISSFTVNPDNGFTMIVSIAHQDNAGNWYTTNVKVNGAPTTLTNEAKKWLQRRVR